MTAVRRLVVLGLVFSLALGGPLAQVASAQQPQQPQQEPQQQPATPEPDLFQEALKATGQAPVTPGTPGAPTSFQPAPPMQPDVMRSPTNKQLSDDFYDVFAGVATAFLIPGKAMTCVLGGGVAGAVFIISLGSAYRAATRVMEEGCGGRWIVNADDIKPGRTQIDQPIERY